MLDTAAANWRTPVTVLLAALACGVALGALTNTIDGIISRDYFAIVMSWDWKDAPALAIGQGALEGAGLGIFLGVFFTIIIAASTRLRCPPLLALQLLAMSVAIVLIAWLLGGIAGIILARLWPSLWGNFFIGVPPRVSLGRFAWVAGSIWGAYAGTPLALLFAGISLHVRWKRLMHSHGGFPVVTPADRPVPA